jgi:hypothetical protein
MRGRCKVCGKRRVMTTHHFHWPKSYIKQWYPKLYERLRSVKMQVCGDCHKDYHGLAFACMSRPYRNCRECKYAVICCYWKRGD